MKHFRRTLIQNAVMILLVLGATAVTAVPALCQLTEQDIEDLREQGKQNGWTFTVSQNPATSRSLEQLGAFEKPSEPSRGTVVYPLVTSPGGGLPAQFDWRDSSVVPPIRDQGECGANWAFATVGMLECNIAIVDGNEVDLSEQWLLKCNTDGWGCGFGGWAHDYHQWKPDQCGDSGAVFESHYAYNPAQQSCMCPIDQHPYFIDGWTYMREPDPYAIFPEIPSLEEIKTAILNYGPIGVTVAYDDAFMSYDGGIFNYNRLWPSPLLPVMLVGWKDNMGGTGVWILRNSWGTEWGDEGYMYIQYGCSFVGAYATFIEYSGPLHIWADTTVGPIPLNVQFKGLTGLETTSWAWDLGDGDSAFVQNPPVHAYDEVGVFDVSVEAETEVGTFGSVLEHFIVAYADTIKGADVAGYPGSQVCLEITANNSMPVTRIRIPVEFPNDFGLVIDSMSTDGCRTSYFEIQDYLHYDPWFGKRATVRLTSSLEGTSPDLAPGSGPVLKLFFTIPDTATANQSMTFDLNGYDDYLPEYIGPYARYVVETVDAELLVSESCCLNRGDIDHNGIIDPMDVAYFSEWLLYGGPPPPCMAEADLDGSGVVDATDLLYLTEYLWNGGPAPVPCP